jgi:hypothetical protein
MEARIMDIRVYLSKHKLANLVENGVVSEVDETGQIDVTIEIK